MESILPSVIFMFVARIYRFYLYSLVYAFWIFVGLYAFHFLKLF